MKIFRVILLLFLACIGLFFISCGHRASPNRNEFSTSQQSELFFRNVRASDYHREIHPLSKWHIYQLKNWQSSEIDVKIIHNWKDNYAWMMLSINTNDQIVMLKSVQPQKSDSFLVNDNTIAEQTQMALWLASHIEHNSGIRVVTQNQTFDILTDDAQRRDFVRMAKDYKKLIE